MKNYFKYDFVKGTIEGTKSAIRRANEGNTPEYKELCEKLQKHPGFKVVEKVIDRNDRTHKGLTIKKMKEYIRLMPESDKLLAEFEAQEKIAKVVGAAYPIMKKWFFEHFPEYKNYKASIEKEEVTVEQNETERVAV